MSEQSIDTSPKEDDVQDYVCPITHEVPKDPVVASDGYTYERVAIEAWLLRCEVNDQYTSPITREEIEQKVYPNRLAKTLQSSVNKEEKSAREVDREASGYSPNVSLSARDTLQPLVSDLNNIKKVLHEKVNEIDAIQHEYQRLQFDNREMSLKLEDLRSDRVEKIKRKCAKRKTSRVFVKTMTGTTVTIDLILDEHTVADLADVYSQRVGIPANQRIRLIFAGRQLEHDKVLSYYNIQNESTLHNVLTLRGD